MEVRRIVVGQIHRDDDSVEVANLWHIALFYNLDAKVQKIFYVRIFMAQLFLENLNC